MPLYEYVCQECQHAFEVLVRGQELPECPSCSSGELQKQFSVPAAHSGSARELPVCQSPTDRGCGLPACGGGYCAME